jgi:3-methylcrotonyl-CoA carboxylase alpha subunit
MGASMTITPIRSVLVANRGEIARRVMRTARRLGIGCIAVYSEADAGAAHVQEADAAYAVGAAPARKSYLDGARIIAQALKASADAVHPGYGFLSENADFAEACGAAGLVFIGPPASAIRAMGSKAAAKALMQQSGVPLVPGYHGEDQAPAFLAAEAARIGFPVLIKASAGGGGKGMRIVERAGDFAEALALAKGEALAAFGDERVLIERYLTRPRHIEIQVFADRQGNAISLFERDCSIQRRHQKIIEEAPAPFMTLARRRAMGEAACAAARAIGYVGAGTVEFIVEDDAFYFMEMNTRLQVEHPVTEAITGLDLVEWQFRVAAGEPLPCRQDDVRIEGHAIEVRLYAEDPAQNFAPSTGIIQHLRWSEHARVDSGVRAGDAVSIHYDPMLAKLIVHGPDRSAAVRMLVQALAETEIEGVRSNLTLLRRIASLPDFAQAVLDTGFIGRHEAILLAPDPPASLRALAAASAHYLAQLARERHDRVDPADPDSPWGLTNAWRMNGLGYQDVSLRDGAEMRSLRLHPQLLGRFVLEMDGQTYPVVAERLADCRFSLTLLGQTGPVSVVRLGAALIVHEAGVRSALMLVDPHASAAGETAQDRSVRAPMPGKILSVVIALGDRVQKGDVLFLVEAMKVQMRVAAPTDGVVALVNNVAGELIEAGAELARIDPMSDA